MDAVSEITTLITSAHSVDALASSTKHLRNAASILKALQNKEVRIPSIPVQKRLSPNAMAEKQKRFFKIRRVRPPASGLSKGTREDIKKSKETLANTDVKVCAICFNEDDATSSSQHLVEWEQCLGCDIWIHVLCSKDSMCTLCK